MTTRYLAAAPHLINREKNTRNDGHLLSRLYIRTLKTEIHENSTILKLAQNQRTWQLCSMPKGLDFPLTIIHGLLDVYKEVVNRFRIKWLHLILKTAE